MNPNQNHWLTTARIGVGLLATTLTTLNFIAYIFFSTQFANMPPQIVWQPELVRSFLATQGQDFYLYLGVLIGLDIFGTLCASSLIFLLLWRKGDDWFGLYLSLMFALLIGFPAQFESSWSPAPFMSRAIEAAGIYMVFILLYLFPNGRFVPSWSRGLLIVYGVGYVYAIFFPNDPANPSLINQLLLLALAVAILIGAGGQIYRYRRVSDSIERQQTKWSAFFFLLWILRTLLLVIPPPMQTLMREPSSRGFALFLFTGASSSVLFSLFMISMVIAIFRYRLFDIDLIIRRTVQYTVISGLGFIAYLLAVGGTSLLFQARSDLAAGIITLVVLVSAFVWLRPRLETLMNKYVPLPQMPPEVLAEMEREKVEREKKKATKEVGEQAVGGDTRLHEPWLTIARVVWVIITGLAVTLFIASIPFLISDQRYLCTTEPCTAPLLNAVEVNLLSQIGLSLTTYTWYFSSLIVVQILAATAVGIFIGWRKSDDWMALCTSVFLITFFISLGTSNALVAQPNWLLPRNVIAGIGQASIFIIFFLFPDGRFVPRWTRWLTLALLVFFSITVVVLTLSPAVAGSPIFGVIIFGTLPFAIGSFIYRYWRVSNPPQRQQIKWVVLSLVVLPLVDLFFRSIVLPLIFPSFQQPGLEHIIYNMVTLPLFRHVPFIFVPVAFAIAIFRYRLYDIDLIIRRTVQYTVISGLGFIAYLLAVGGTSLLFQARSDLAAGIITLVVLVGAVVWLRPRLETLMNKYMPLPQLPPEVLAEMEREKAEREKKKAIKEVGEQTVGGDTRLQGDWLTIVRLVWFVCALVVAIILLGALPGYYSHYAQAIGTDPYDLGQFNQSFQVLVGLSNFVSDFSSFALAILLFWRKPNDRMALFASFFLLITAVASTYSLDYFLTAYFGAPSTYELGSTLQTPLWILVFCIFPDGRFVPRWTRWLFLASILISFLILTGGEWSVMSYPIFILVMYAQVYRHRRVSNDAERKQTQWVVFGLFVSLVLSLIASIIYKRPSPPLINIFPLSLTIAILHSRLWNIDLIIRRTVQYTVISGLGFIAYLLAVGGTSLLFQTRSDLAAGIITLVVLVSAFVWLRPRLETLMNKYMPLPELPLEVLSEMEREKVERERKRAETATQKTNLNRVLTIVFAILVAIEIGYLVVGLASIPTYYQRVTQQTIETTQLFGREFVSNAWIAQAAEQRNLSLTQYALYRIISSTLATLIPAVIALFMLWRARQQWFIWLTAFTIIFLGQSNLGELTIVARLIPVQVFGLNTIFWFILMLFFFLFPTGKRVPRKWGWLVIGLVIYHFFIQAGTVLHYAAPQMAASLNLPSWSNSLYVLPVLLNFLVVFACQIYRYRHVSTPIERQQTKWFVLGFAFMLVIVLVGLLFQANLLTVSQGSFLQDFLMASLWMPVYAGIAIAILRYRLFDIDIIIRRTVQYTVISGLGFIAYLLAVGGTSLLFQARSDLAAGIITLVVLVSAFVWLRPRLETLMNKYMPLPQLPPEVVVEMEREKAEKEARKRMAVNRSSLYLSLWRWSAFAIMILCVILFVWNLLLWPASAPTNLTLIRPSNTWTDTALLAAIQEAGLSVVSLNAYQMLLTSIPALLFVIVAGIIFVRRSTDWFSIYLSLLLVIFGTMSNSLASAIRDVHPVLNLLKPLLSNAGWIGLFPMFYLFPTGTFVPRWTRWMLVVLASFLLLLLLNTAGWLTQALFDPIGISIAMALFMGGAGSQIYRYQKHSDMIQRQQTKWVLIAIVIFVLSTFLALGRLLLQPAQSFTADGLRAYLIVSSIFSVVNLLLPVSIGFAILRYRLFDIDLIIRRTVQYTVISGLGFIAYLLAVGGTSLLFQARSDLAAGIIALVVLVSAFVWLRPRLETLMNKYMPLPQLPPEALAEIAHEKTKQDKKKVAPTMNTDSTGIQGNWLIFVRLVWISLALIALTMFFVGMPQRLDPQSALCAPPATPCQRNLISAAEAALLPQIGLTLETYNLFAVITQYGLMPLLWLAMSALIFWRKSDDWLGVITAWFMIGFPFAIFTGGLITSNPILIIFGGILRWFNGILPTLFFFFPSGRFVPRWTRWVVAGFAISHTLNFIWQLQILLTKSPIPTGPNIFGIIYIGVFILSVGCQIYRYWRVSTTDERRQTNWIFVSILTLPGLDLLLRVIMEAVFPQWHQPGLAHIIYNLIADPLLAAGFLLVPIAFAIAVLRYRLYAIDLVIRRTVIYGGIVGGLALIYFGGIALLQFLSQVITGPQSDLVIILITLGIVALFNPVRRRLQTWLDRAFYREKVDFREALTAFTREVRTIIDLQELLRTLVNRTTDLLHITHGAVFLWTGQATPQLAEGRNFNGDAATLTLNNELLNSLESGQAVSRPDHSTFPLLIPLIAPTNPQPLIGVLALGKRLSDQQYSREDQTLLRSLADQAGTALYVAQLIQERQRETQLRAESDRQLVTYHHSPAGRAEALAQSLILNPQTSLVELHTLVQNAEHDVETAQLLDPLPHAFENLNAPLLAGFAEGYRFIFTSQFNPELLAVGLRQLIQQLESPTAQDVNGVTEALLLYRFSQQALDVNSIPQISDCSTPLAELPTALTDFKPFAQALGELSSVCDALRAYERVDAVQDKLAYLASAIERLSHAERYARAELSLPDKIILIRLVANWLRVVTGAMSEVQTRARLVVQLLTRHTWTGEIVTVALNLRNEGRGIALNLKVSLAASTDYTLLDETAVVEQLSAGEETQVELRVRPRLTQGLSQFRARFIIIYDDSRGRDQVENFADVVYLLAEEGEFKFVPNPYVVGTPLQTGSSLFFGRADVFNFIQENLAAAHQNNLVLIGQRRTGKTSLLKQLPAQLGDSYMPIYLDGQSLALDPGLPNFFYSLATEIAFALEDRGLPVPAPELASFADSPTHTFERKFLPQVYEVLAGRHLLLLLDEFEELENAVRRGNIDASVFSFLRHLMQHATQLSVIFCGTHRMEELAADYWSVLFNISLYKHIAFLGQAETLRLIQEPVASYGMKYDDLALDKMWRVTAGHPYFLQLLCHSLVNRHNKSQRNYLTIADVNDALEEILATGEAHFVYLWTESTRTERLILTALSRLMPLTGHTTVVQVTDYLSERGINLERRTIAEALHHLALRDILRPHGNEPARELLTADGYAWQLGLLGLWVEKYKSLSRVVDETRE